jgi:hypothetical protein
MIAHALLEGVLLNQPVRRSLNQVRFNPEGRDMDLKLSCQKLPSHTIDIHPRQNPDPPQSPTSDFPNMVEGLTYPAEGVA